MTVVVEQRDGDVHIEVLVAVIQRPAVLVLCRPRHGHCPKAAGLAEDIGRRRHPREAIFAAAVPSFEVHRLTACRTVCASLDALPQADCGDGGHEEEDGCCDGQAPDGLDFIARGLAGIDPFEGVG